MSKETGASSVSVYVLVAIVKKRLNLPASLYQILQILSLTMFERMPLNQLLSKMSVDSGIDDCKRGKTRGDGMILRFPDRRESDSFWEWCRLAILTVYPMPS